MDCATLLADPEAIRLEKIIQHDCSLTLVVRATRAQADVAAYASARQVAAFAGVAPRRHESGSSVRGRGRLSKVGSSRLRPVLYFPAVAALRCDAGIRRWAEGLRERGKRPKVVICAVMRKLIHIAYGVLKTRCPFDPARIHA